MILREIAACLQQKQRMTGRELARQFHTSEDAMDAMIGVWMRKGRVRKITAAGCKGSCCGQRSEIFYEWQPEGLIGFIQKN
ncbi:FeoC-like transcriptional regulator [Tolumonas lignilytica]|jgi:FeoC like transcriptional regulator.|uniref:FeoC-like transcriptional regulator n=1 Tax=Tolumonas lignilytica TaxID=1283284 RepID=UPI0004649641|nr:FeoC-like transcriptional regulator [Tolumonas lignilytica]